MEKWLLLIQTVCTDPAREQEFQEWYTNVHVPNVLRTPGFVRGTRYVIKEPNEAQGKYLALYEIETEDIEKTEIALRQRVREIEAQGMRSPLLGSVSRTYWRQISPSIESHPK